MKLEQALAESDYDTAQLSHDGDTTVVDGSSSVYWLTVSLGAMPPHSTEPAASLQEAMHMIAERGLDTDNWRPVGEHGDPSQ